MAKFGHNLPHLWSSFSPLADRFLLDAGDDPSPLITADPLRHRVAAIRSRSCCTASGRIPLAKHLSKRHRRQELRWSGWSKKVCQIIIWPFLLFYHFWPKWYLWSVLAKLSHFQTIFGQIILPIHFGQNWPKHLCDILPIEIRSFLHTFILSSFWSNWTSCLSDHIWPNCFFDHFLAPKSLRLVLAKLFFR